MIATLVDLRFHYDMEVSLDESSIREPTNIMFGGSALCESHRENAGEIPDDLGYWMIWKLQEYLFE